MAVGLERFEFVAHAFVAATGPHAAVGWTWLTDLWARLGSAFGIAQPIAGSTADLPPRAPEADGVVAARTASAPGVHQAVVRRVGDVVCLSVVRAPTAGGPRWDTFDAEWSAVLPTPTAGVLGVARILQAQLDDPAQPVDAAALGPVVAGMLPVAGDWSSRGIVRPEGSWGPFAVWEASGPSAAEDRADRRIVVVVGHDRDDPLSAWTWSLGEELAPLAHYLLHAAKTRFQMRLWSADGAAGRSALRRATDQAIAPLLRLSDEVVEGGEPRPEALLAATTPLVRLRVSEADLADRASRLHDIARVVEIAANNMATRARRDQAGGLFLDDAELARWMQRQLGHDAAFLESAADRARAVAALGDHLVTRGLATRRERVNLILTGVIGAVVAVLTAIQAFGYQVPLAEPAKAAVIPPVIAAIGALALVLYMAVLPTVPERRSASAAARSVTLGLLAAMTAWLVTAVACTLSGLPLPAPASLTAGAAAVGIAATAVSMWFLRRSVT